MAFQQGVAQAAPSAPAESEVWAKALSTSRASLLASAPPSQSQRARRAEVIDELQRNQPLVWDWMLQDCPGGVARWLSARESSDLDQQMIRRGLDELPAPSALRREFSQLVESNLSAGDPRWLLLYRKVCEARRQSRLTGLIRQWPRVVFTKHYNLGGSHYAYTEGQSDAQNERTFVPGSALCLLVWEGGRARLRTLLEDPDGVIRDPDVSWDGKRVLFSWKKSDRQDDYHLYEIDLSTLAAMPPGEALETRAAAPVRQITSGLGFADYEAAYLPDDTLVFTSTRCVQTVDCWWTEVSNLYTCDAQGRFLRRLAYDQVHDNFPTVLPDGRVIYTRWEYNDRGQIFVQGLFQMQADGTGQAEFYGNNSWFPTSLLHARGIPGTQKVMAIFSGHHSLQAGKLGILDVNRGRQENQGAQLIAPLRPTPAERIDAYGQEGDLFQYPYPLNEQACLVAMAPGGWAREATHFKLYWVHADGRREMLAADPSISCNQPIPLAPRARPAPHPSAVDYRQQAATCYVQDVYAGAGMAGVPRGSVKRLRVVGLEFRAAGVGCNYNAGVAGSALASTPVAIGNGAWDVKTVLGEAMVHPDGSSYFTVPARTPVYFQALDERGYAIQTMRSWSTLQPGERATCVGCHEAKSAAPLAAALRTTALRGPPQDLELFHGPARGFSFPREIQPILDRHCVLCHPGPESALSLRSTPVIDSGSKRAWSEAYLALVGARTHTIVGQPSLAAEPSDMANWVPAQSAPEMLAPYAHGAARSRLMELLQREHRGATLTRAELERFACWLDLAVPYCGDYTEANAWTPEERERYQRFLDKRRRMEQEERDNIRALIVQRHQPHSGGPDETPAY